MELREGYKQTEVGVIPDDWEVTTLNDVCCIPMQNGVFFKPSSKGKGVRLINVGDLYKHTPVDVTILERFNATDDEKIRFKVDDGDLFFTRSSIVPSGIAHCNVYKKTNSECVVFDSHVIRVRPDYKKIFSLYLYRFCVSNVARSYLVSHAKTATMTTIDQGVLKKCPVLLPSKTEQTAIANALSDADAWIQSLTRLIAKKRQIKQGAMQTLLNPYENGCLKAGWVVKKLGDVADVRDGTHQTPKYVDSGIPFYSVENVTRDDFINTKFISKNEHKILTKTLKMKKGDVLMTRIGSIGDCKLIDWDVDASFYVSLALIKLKVLVNARYFLHYSKTYFFQKELENNSLQFAIPKKINLSQLENVLLAMPDDIEQQILIGSLLSDMDNEIIALETKLTKAQQIKQGMMQNLLTGKIRLIGTGALAPDSADRNGARLKPHFQRE